jgi:hypothetical protein
MGLFRALNLLQGVEAQTTLGPALEAILSASTAQESEFGALLSTRHMARRMAGNPVTMSAINASDTAIELVFTNTSLYNSEPVKEVAKNSAAMANTSITLASLNAVTANDTAFGYFSVSEFYEDNILNILSTLIGDPVGTHASLAAMVANTTAMNAITLNTGAVKALAASTLAMTQVVLVGPAVADLAGNTAAITIIANSAIAVAIVGASTLAIDNLTSEARTIVTSVPSALAILGANHTGWQYILDTSTILDDNIYGLMIAFGGLNPATFADSASIFADATATAAVAGSHPATMAIITEEVDVNGDYVGVTSALELIIASDNLDTFLQSSVAMEHITPSVSIMTTLIGNAVAFPILLTSTAAKAAIFASTTLSTAMLTTGSDSLATVQGLAVSATVANDTVIGTFQTLGISGNIIILTGVLGSIVATETNCSFDGDNEPVFTIGLTGTSLSSGPKDINKPYTNAIWDIAAIAATAAATITFTYADFN